MNENSVITIDGKEYELLLTTKATKEIAFKYGGLENLGSVLSESENQGENFAKVIWFITLLANQPILIHNLKNPQDKKELLTEDYIELLTVPSEIELFNPAIMTAMNKGMKRTVESETGEGDAKNIQGA